MRSKNDFLGGSAPRACSARIVPTPGVVYSRVAMKKSQAEKSVRTGKIKAGIQAPLDLDPRKALDQEKAADLHQYKHRQHDQAGNRPEEHVQEVRDRAVEQRQRTN